MNTSQKVIDWRKRTKERIVLSMGGSCTVCNYNRCNDALELHHLDPSTKELSFAGIRANPASWSRIVQELRKCVMVCSNCHKEIEAGLITLEHKKYFNENYSDPLHFSRQLHGYREKSCIDCGNKYKPTSGTQKRCLNCIPL